MRKVAVIGLGRFGTALARQLSSSGVQVIAIDRNGQSVNEIKDDVALAVRCDSTDEAVLRSQDVDKVDVCVISIGENFEAALLTTVLAKEMEIPQVICRAQSRLHAEIFKKIGADRVIQPEEESGANLARQLANPQLIDFIRLADGYTLMEFAAPALFQHKSLKSLGLRSKYDVNLVAIRRPIDERDPAGNRMTQTIVPKPEDVIVPGDILVIVGADEALARLPRE